VQTIVSDLKKVLPGLKITDVWCGWTKMIKKPDNFADFREKLVEKKILEVRRQGKNILIDLSGGQTLLIHQKMTGHLLYGKYRIKTQNAKRKTQNNRSKSKNEKNLKWVAAEAGPLRDDPYNRFVHLVFELSNGRHLALSDLRKFAKVLIWPTPELNELDDLRKLGPDPLDKSFSFPEFKKIFNGKKGKMRAGAAFFLGGAKAGQIKKFLMEQKNIAGIGNIYSDEILWEAGIHPLKNIQEIKEADLRKIFNAIKKVLKKAIKAKGDSISDYRRPSGEKGGYQNIQNAYHMTGKKCGKNDGGVIQRIKIGGRSAHFCTVHQKL